MAKSGQARVPTPEQKDNLFYQILKHRHPEKNEVIMRVSFALGLRAQEIAALQIKEVAKLDTRLGMKNRNFKLLEIMPLPASITKGANFSGRSKSTYKRKSVSFKVEDFNQKIKQIVELTKAGVEVDPKDFYPPIQQRKGQSRDLPMVDLDLREALSVYVRMRLDKDPYLQPTSPLIITQKGGPYSPNTLQEHMALMLREWTNIEKASSHSGRRALITDILHNQEKSLKVGQKIAGHKSASTTVIYDEPPETEIADALRNIGIPKNEQLKS